MAGSQEQSKKLCIVVLSAAAALALVVAFHLFDVVPTDEDPADEDPGENSTITDVATAVYATFGVFYGVLLAQIVLAAWSDREDARTAVYREADALSDLLRLSAGFDIDDRRNIQQLAEKYADSVISGWSKHATDPDAHEAGEKELLELVRIYAHARPADAFLSASLDQLDALGDARGDRLMAGRSSLPDSLWAVLIFQGVLVVGFSAVFFNLSNFDAHRGLVLVLAVVMFLFIALVWCLDHPFNCWPTIGPDDLRRAKMLARRMQD